MVLKKIKHFWQFISLLLLSLLPLECKHLIISTLKQTEVCVIPLSFSNTKCNNQDKPFKLHYRKLRFLHVN